MDADGGSKLTGPGALFLSVKQVGTGTGAHAPNCLAKAIDRKRLAKQGKSPVGDEALRKTCHRQDPEVGAKHREHFGELPASDARHGQISDDQIESSGMFLDQPKRRLRVLRLQHNVPIMFEYAAHHAAH